VTSSGPLVKVLIVDDSALVRQVLTDIVVSDGRFEVVGAACDPYAAVEKMREVAPDVIVLDVEMPRMDGVTFLRKLMQQRPIPTVICSTLVEGGSDTAIAALEAGAVEIIQKPTLGVKQFLQESHARMCDAIFAASKAKLQRRSREAFVATPPRLSADAILPLPSRAMVKTTQRIIVVGASTGGTEALSVLITSLPLDAPGMAVVQHMPEGFTASFAKRLNQLAQVEVKEAEHGDTILTGRVLIARGNRHLLLQRSGAKYLVALHDGPPVSRHRPSVDVLFRSAASCAGQNAIGVIMTGMGDDGAQGLLEMRQAGARTFGQDEATCIVYGMPAEAVKRGAVECSLPLNGIAGAIYKAAYS
jgi:two-component system, chemotaxis family, protein-glutamate methylesterase/glutaminase